MDLYKKVSDNILYKYVELFSTFIKNTIDNIISNFGYNFETFYVIFFIISIIIILYILTMILTDFLLKLEDPGRLVVLYLKFLMSTFYLFLIYKEYKSFYSNGLQNFMDLFDLKFFLALSCDFIPIFAFTYILEKLIYLKKDLLLLICLSLLLLVYFPYVFFFLILLLSIIYLCKANTEIPSIRKSRKYYIDNDNYVQQKLITVKF